MEYENLKELALYTKNTPLPGYTFPNFLYLLTQNKFKIDAQYIPRMMYSLTLSAIMFPFYLKERLQFDRGIEQTEITKPPVFIIGHWRSGTTHLHNVLSCDKNLGYFTTFQAYLPAIFLGSENLFKPLVSSSIPTKRPMDNVEMNADFPQEDQYALGAFSPYSYYHGWCFPKNMEFYNEYVCMENVPKKIRDEWKGYYLYLLKKITLYHQGKQLVLKNQDNTGKIRMLLDVFPDAKFIYLYRNPYDLYFSMMKFIKIAIPRFCIQKPPKIEDVEQSMMALYARMIQKYIKEREDIPKGNLIEVRYEDYILQPLHETKRIYETLHLEGFQDAESAFQVYINTQKSMKKDHYMLAKEQKQKIETKWGFSIKEFGY
jgi:hypothetical protein